MCPFSHTEERSKRQHAPCCMRRSVFRPVKSPQNTANPVPPNPNSSPGQVLAVARGRGARYRAEASSASNKNAATQRRCVPSINIGGLLSGLLLLGSTLWRVPRVAIVLDLQRSILLLPRARRCDLVIAHAVPQICRARFCWQQNFLAKTVTGCFADSYSGIPARGSRFLSGGTSGKCKRTETANLHFVSGGLRIMLQS